MIKSNEIIEWRLAKTNKCGVPPPPPVGNHCELCCGRSMTYGLRSSGPIAVLTVVRSAYDIVISFTMANLAPWCTIDPLNSHSSHSRLFLALSDWLNCTANKLYHCWEPGRSRCRQSASRRSSRTGRRHRSLSS